MTNVKIIFGAPGCGKTTELMATLETELKQHDPDKIAFVSFTRKGTYEGVNRAREKFGFGVDDLPYFRTLHAIAFRQGGYKKIDMIQKRHYLDFSRSMDMNFTGYYTEDFYNNDDRYLFLTILERNNPYAAEHFAFDMDVTVLEAVRRNYVRFKQFARVVDFTDIIEEFIKANKPLPVDVAIIDEAQDLTTLQWKFCEVAFRNCQKVYVAGDDEQAIYEWSGADVRHFLALEGERKILQRSYRLPRRILNLSKQISAMIHDKVEKNFDCTAEAGEIYFHNTIEDVPLNKGQSYYFLSRNNYFLFVHREYLRKRSQVFYDKDKFSVDPREVEAIHLFERWRKGALSDIELVKLKVYLRTDVDKSKPWYSNLAFDADKIAYYKDLIRAKTDLSNRQIMVNTIHGVKGGEADNVVLLMDITQAVKLNMENNPDSELRCLYVACTRAKKALHIVHSNTKNGYDEYLKLKGD